MKIRLFILICFSIAFSSGQAQIKHVILVSIDGFHPDMYLDKGWPTPNLQQLMKKGTYANYMLSVFPAYTHPAHAAMETGSFPARSGIAYNQPVNSRGEWFWYYKSIKAPTIWQALKDRGMTTAAIMWPNVVDGPITYNLGEIWDEDHPDDRATPVRKHAIPKGIYEEIEQNATGKLDSTNMNDNYFSLDENAGRMAAYIFKTKKPAFMALHFATVDGEEHEFGRDADSVRLAVEANDRAIGDVMEAIKQSGLKDSTAVIIVGDHGFSTIHQVMRPNMLIRNVPATFIAAGGSAFLYRFANTKKTDEAGIVRAVTDSLNKLPADKRKLFRIISRKELDEMGADSAALLALTAVPGTVFSGAVGKAKATNYGPGTRIQNDPLEGVLIPATGGHHGYDPNIADMHTGFIAYGAGINKGGHIKEMRVVDIAPLIAKLLGIEFNTPDGKLVEGIIK
ncbi:ectonucleotide pyrophosphatase/phosphodiesterase [Mucilaginibacter sp. BJC16-A38]|uniref:alkaline phosphatase family protein n=1 Tax=Mucilaginibacter phenanthrenivorans TaxID=1234842 RepID=UPI00215774F2|nr:ectonucleotide pyrophosphatase/phosphodiesterase [Mucilaginibacter phenanthrenivorans]MCR8556960.1 ectonucleotide pyrophosphatase/phosphodiesterase [Mucilaginibacter phenanthrenivorans]